jgi:hypothetical protein
VGYLVYTIGTLITAPASLNVAAAVAGLLAVVCFAAVILWNAKKNAKALAAAKK